MSKATYILIPIRERWLADIFAGRKVFELRIRRIACPRQALLYASGKGSRHAVVGICEISMGVAVTPAMQEETIRGACVTREEFEAYAHPPGKYPRVVYRHLLGHPVEFAKPMPLSVLNMARPPKTWHSVYGDIGTINSYIQRP